MSAALNAEVTVTIRIEGRDATIFEGFIKSNGHDVKIPSSSTARPCDGTNGNEHPFPVPTVTAALDTVASANPTVVILDGTYYPQFEDWIITKITDTAGAGEFWNLLLNSRPINVGGSQQRIQQGDSLLFALVPTANKDPVVLKLKGPRVATRAAGVVVNVVNAVTRAAVVGAIVTGGAADVATDTEGNATVKFPTANTMTLKAKVYNGIRSEKLTVTVAT